MSGTMSGIAPSRTTRWIIGVVVGVAFAIPLVSTFLYTLRNNSVEGQSTGGLSLTN